MKPAWVLLALAGVAQASGSEGGSEVTRTQTTTTAPASPPPAKPVAAAPPAKPVAAAPPAAAAPPPSTPDLDAEQAASEANLESDAPRSGVTFSFSAGAGLTMGDGVGRGPAVSFRLGHVATPLTVLTFELVVGSLLHEPAGSSTILHNDDLGLMAGALHYVNRSLWIRGAGGLTVYTVQNMAPEVSVAHAGVGGLVGLGIDFVRWHYLVLGLETYSQLSIVSTKGLLYNNGLCLGLTYY